MIKNLLKMNSEKKVEDNNIQSHDGNPHVLRSSGCEHGWHDGSCCCNCTNQLSYYQKFIVVSEDWRPMAFSGEQFCYCTNEDWQCTQWPVQLYSRKDAEKLIEATVKYRQEQGFDVGRYLLMPVWAHGL